MTRRAIAGSLLAASAIVATSCKLDSVVFSGDAVKTYEIPATLIPDSLRTEVQFVSSGETLFGYHLRQPGAAARLGILFSHGKGGNLSQAEEWAHAEMLWRAGFDVLTYDYRGFGKSTGKSKDETTLIADAQAALAFFAARIPGGGPRESCRMVTRWAARQPSRLPPPTPECGR